MQTVDGRESPLLKQTVEAEDDKPLKEMIINHVGEKLNPENGNITVEMILEVVAEEFPEFVLALAEENWVRGYHQALCDIEGQFEASDAKNE
tara:strand:- start:285 stop:560 length:276 start_codon:yes stop_codon:yes gene_type:complete